MKKNVPTAHLPAPAKKSNVTRVFVFFRKHQETSCGRSLEFELFHNCSCGTMDEPISQTIEQALAHKFPSWSAEKCIHRGESCKSVDILDVDDLKIYTDSGLDKLQVSETVRSALRALKADFIPPATTPSNHSAVSFDEDVSTPATKKARLIAPPTIPSMLANKSIPASKKVPGKISFYFETWTKTKKCSDGGTVTFNQFSEEVQHSPAKK